LAVLFFFLAGDFLAVVFFAVAFRAVDFRAVFRAVDLRAVDLRAVVFLTVFFLVAALRFAGLLAVFFAADFLTPAITVLLTSKGRPRKFSIGAIKNSLRICAF